MKKSGRQVCLVTKPPSCQMEDQGRFYGLSDICQLDWSASFMPVHTQIHTYGNTEEAAIKNAKGVIFTKDFGRH